MIAAVKLVRQIEDLERRVERLEHLIWLLYREQNPERPPDFESR